MTVTKRRKKYGLNQRAKGSEIMVHELIMFLGGPRFVREAATAGSFVDELKKTLANCANVIRNETLVEDEARLFPSILQLWDGVVIAADGGLVSEDCSLQIDQSAITGESLAVDKRHGDSSTVKAGEAFMVVTATGDNALTGRAAALVDKASGQGHFTEVLNGAILLVSVIVTCCFYRPIRMAILRHT